MAPGTPSSRRHTGLFFSLTRQIRRRWVVISCRRPHVSHVCAILKMAHDDRQRYTGPRAPHPSAAWTLNTINCQYRPLARAGRPSSRAGPGSKTQASSFGAISFGETGVTGIDRYMPVITDMDQSERGLWEYYCVFPPPS
jgi:hypothetical protein